MKENLERINEHDTRWNKSSSKEINPKKDEGKAWTIIIYNLKKKEEQLERDLLKFWVHSVNKIKVTKTNKQKKRKKEKKKNNSNKTGKKSKEYYCKQSEACVPD